jgi:hypothetical protein
VHPKMQGRGVGGFMLEQLQHLARARGCTHLVLEVAENNRAALTFYKRRSFQRLDAAIFMAQKIALEPELLPPRVLEAKPEPEAAEAQAAGLDQPAEPLALESAPPPRRKKSSKPPARARRGKKKPQAGNGG